VTQPVAALIAEVDAAVAQMTPGPWGIDGNEIDTGADSPSYMIEAGTLCGYDGEGTDAAGIVALRNAWPRVSQFLADCVAELQRLRPVEAERDQLRAQLAESERAEDANAKLRAILRAIVADSTCMPGEVIWPPGLALISQARAVLADLPEETT
jgi:hypothetical protein